MQYITPIYLCSNQYSQATNDIGESIGSLTKKKIYGSEESAKRQEFYQASANGYKIEKVIVVRKFEYANEEIVILDDTEYSVLRAFDPKDGNIELILTKGVIKNVSA